MRSVEFIYGGGAVKRFHTLPMLKEDTVAQHSFGVAWFCYLLDSNSPSAALLMAALSHDLAEQSTGDIPAPAKRALGIKEQFDAYEDTVFAEHGMPNFYAKLNDAEKRILKIADSMDGAMRCIYECRQGNKFMRLPLNRFLSYIEELNPRGIERILLDEILSLIPED